MPHSTYLPEQMGAAFIETNVIVIAAAPGKVHLDVRSTRYRKDNSVLGQFRSLRVIAGLDGVLVGRAIAVARHDRRATVEPAAGTLTIHRHD